MLVSEVHCLVYDPLDRIKYKLGEKRLKEKQEIKKVIKSTQYLV